jgi:hypothetical protein
MLFISIFLVCLLFPPKSHSLAILVLYSRCVLWSRLPNRLITTMYGREKGETQYTSWVVQSETKRGLSCVVPTTVYCTTTLHCTTLHCTTLHCTTLHCTTLHYTALHCTALLHCTAALYCTTPFHCTILFIMHCTTLQVKTCVHPVFV